MKSQQDFPTEQQYKDYLKVYFTAVAMQGIAGAVAVNENLNAQARAKKCAELSTTYADEVIKILIPDKR